jgi:two-component system, OmpR family, phosphate regulon response regulator OmpR
MAERLLIVDDDKRLSAMVAEYLSSRGFDVEQRADVATGYEAATRGSYDIVVLDVMLPDGDGFELCRRVRAVSTVPIVMLTARGDETDRIVGLEIGADDYLPKPFNPRELLARLRAVLRRNNPATASNPELMRFGALTVDRAAREARVAGRPCDLTSHQFALLVALIERRGRVLSREQLMEAVRGEELEAFDRSIDVHISRIRAAIELDPKRPRFIKTVRSVGYVFTNDPEPA